VYEGRNVLDVLQNRKKKLRRVLKGWNLNIESVYKKERKKLSDLLNSIDINSETVGLLASDYELRISLQYQLNYLLREE
jgi:ADP-dependent phosphofructokinase/glucokinase